MTGCFGNSQEDRIREHEVDHYTNKLHIPPEKFLLEFDGKLNGKNMKVSGIAEFYVFNDIEIYQPDIETVTIDGKNVIEELTNVEFDEIENQAQECIKEIIDNETWEEL